MHHTVNLTHNDAQEVLHKLGVMADEPELAEGYGLTIEQAIILRDSVPDNGGGWAIPDWGLPAVSGEILDHCELLRQQAYEVRHEDPSLARRITKQFKKLEASFSI